MTTQWDRIEPHTRTTELDESLQARIADPLWMLARQWQLGEFRGEDAATPVHVHLRAASNRLVTLASLATSPASKPEPCPSDTPLEARVEAESLDDGPGRRLLAVEAGHDAQKTACLRFRKLHKAAGFFRQFHAPPGKAQWLQRKLNLGQFAAQRYIEFRLRTRTERMHSFSSAEATEEWAMKLVNYPAGALAVVLPPGAARRVKAYAHLLCGEVDPGVPASAAAVVEVPPPEDWKAKVEAELAGLRRELNDIKSALGL